VRAMAERVKIPPAPTVYCPKDKEKVPIWHCLGSFTQGRETCPYLVKATVHGGESAEVECKWEVKHDGRKGDNSTLEDD